MKFPTWSKDLKDRHKGKDKLNSVHVRGAQLNETVFAPKLNVMMIKQG